MRHANSKRLTNAESAWIAKLARAIRSSKPDASASKQTLAKLRFAVKDNIDVKNIPTTAACPDFRYTPKRNALVVQNLIDAGATLVGKTNLDQFACGLNGTRSPYGIVPNSFNSEFVSGGSSSGSAYVVATGQVDFALGTDTAGSGRVPAGLNNIVGLKPTRGLISAKGVVPAARSVDTVSIFARDVATAWRVLRASISFDPSDPYSRSIRIKPSTFPSALRVGIPDRCEWYGDTISEQHFEQAKGRITALGGQLEPIPYKPLLQAASLLYESALVAERLEVTEPMLDESPDSFDQAVHKVLIAAKSYSAADAFRSLNQVRHLKLEADSMWSNIDVLMVPTAPRHYRITEMLADPIELNRRLGYYTNFVNMLDYAAASVPSSIRSDGLPFGVTFIAPAGSDYQLAEWAHRFHRHTGLTLGATDEALPESATTLEPFLEASDPSVRIAVVGAHLRGMPLNGQLTACQARFIRESSTSNAYRLYALADTVPPKPGLIRVPPGTGACIAIEIWEMPLSSYGSFVSQIPSPLGVGQISTRDNELIQGFLCESLAIEGSKDITAYGGWKAYLGLKT
ncbi:MAG: allophanate hydrolase [Betaproteobacteria bacterium]|nr:allophanate hydrolase [Betaproteobacteria bacterium]NCY20179.1 allophanate hydrolase [Betaproteobacteria bacterium]NDA88225.1 allophanate hydrolase [Betaproteobacteria bacterium]NDB41143.1 allophanate hydrolase [Betaproteobacteria bacterium]NDB99654.1 allophanate hydrolase [Betaproteobacteria bacterium]